jgi:hypothetical protein
MFASGNVKIFDPRASQLSGRVRVPRLPKKMASADREMAPATFERAAMQRRTAKAMGIEVPPMLVALADG